MYKIFLLIALCAISFSQTVVNDDLYDLISDLRYAMDGEDSGNYTIPTQAERDSFALIIDRILAGSYADAAQSADSIDYDLLNWNDTGNSSAQYYVLKEDSAEFSDNAAWKGWGTYIFKVVADQTALVQVPHVRFDTNSWRIGFEAYRANNSKYYMMAGAHRYANGRNPAVADVAHDTLNMFHIVHKKLSPLSSKAVQIHGFKQSNYGVELPDVIVSSGTSLGSADATSMASAINETGFVAGIYDNDTIPHLGATTNVQGLWTRNLGQSFVHVEIDSFIRFNSSNRAILIPAIANGLDPEDTPLPVKLVGSLNVLEINGGFEISARTASEADVLEIYLQRKTITESSSSSWQTINTIKSDDLYTSGRILPVTRDYIPMAALQAVSYRLISVDYAGLIDENIPNAEQTIYFNKTNAKSADALLLQSSPNPFNKSTTIRFIVEKESAYSLVIYDVLGRKVRTLLNKQFISPQDISSKWNGKNNFGNKVATGIYFYQLLNHKTGQYSVKKSYFLR